MKKLTTAEAARHARARLVGPADVVIDKVVIDARQATPGALFVAIAGERVDGHDFAEQARANGAVAVLGTRETDADLAHLVVDDSVAGLSALARGVVAEAIADGLTTIAITGSSGKTSTKDLLAQVLEAAAPTVSPVGSFNNEIGVPLTACGVEDDTRFLVSEMGARGLGHIAWLCSVVPPRVGMVLNVGHAHLGEFGSAEGIAQAKGEIVEGLPAEGWAVLNADDHRVAAMVTRTAGRIAWFTRSAEPLPHESLPHESLPDESLPDDVRCDLVVRAVDVHADALQRSRFTLEVVRNGATERHEVSLRVLGDHQVSNAIAAAAAAIAAGVEPQIVAHALSAATTRSHWRMELTERADGAAVLNDAYNANPDSMAAALHTLGGIAAARRAIDPCARAIAVLGDMLELGDDAPALHAELGRLAAEVGVDEVVAVGEYAEQIAGAARDAGIEARALPRREVSGSLALGPADVVLVKASRGLALETVADELVAATADKSGAEA
ncbi:UDP-N-acetylmuramoyl-tripeptide--D-alanyl-D-alanine ligase [Luteococcus sanguinis]|uniref:UDP-N-acetylmuramoyl-tripeptide--D-alanyl-D-alanine ligase n=1 Tax=Luteococcus sanguinis TaxID=174038 RepID=A0ABW1X2C4_9ACTN